MDEMVLKSMKALLTNSAIVQAAARKKYNLDERWRMCEIPPAPAGMVPEWVSVQFYTVEQETLHGRVMPQDIRNFVVMPGDEVVLDETTPAVIVGITDGGMSAIIQYMAEVTVDIRRIQKA